MKPIKRYRATGLAQAIEQQGRVREWVAQKAQVHPSLITHLLAGRRTVRADVAERISAALDVPLSLLFELSDSSSELPMSEREAIPA